MSVVDSCQQNIPAVGNGHPSSERREVLRSCSIFPTSCFRAASLNAWDDDMSDDSSKFAFDIDSREAQRDIGRQAWE